MERIRFAIAVALVTAVLAGTARAQEGMVVKEITFTGTGTWDASSLKMKLATKEGQRFSDRELADDVSVLMGFFSRVTAERSVVEGGVKVSFIVEANPEISSVVFRDFSAIDTAEVLKDPGFSTKRGFPFAEFKVQRDRQYLVERLREKGHYFAEVQVAAGDYGTGKQVLFTAVQGPEVEIDEIRFTGLSHFEESDLTDRMDSEEEGLFSDGSFVMKKLDSDLIRIAQFLRGEGYLDATITLKDLAFSADNEEVTITIGVEEGPPYTLTDVVIEGGASFPPDRSALMAKVKTDKGAPPREEEIDLTRRGISEYYLQNAYYDVSVDTELDSDASAKTSVLRIRIEEGRPARIRFVEIAGNIQTRDKVIRRNLSVHPGGPLNSIQLRKSVSRVEALGYFDILDGVTSKVEDTDEEGVKDVVVTVKEGRTGSLQLAGAVGSESGLSLIFDAQKKNFDYSDLPPDPYNPLSVLAGFFSGEFFTGGGQTLGLTLSPGTEVSRYQLYFAEPWFLDEYLFYGPSGEVEETPFSFTVDLYHRIDGRFAYDETKTGIGFGSGKAWRKPGGVFDDVWSARLDFRWENVKVDDLDSDAPPNAYVWEGNSQVHKLSLDLGWSHVDLPAYPGEGFEADLSYTMAGGPFGGEVDYHMLEAGGTVYKTLYTTKRESRHILSFTARVGWAHEFGSTDDVPIFDRYFLGGHTTVRGFDYGEVGPRASGNPYTNEGRQRIIDSMAKGNGQPTGGEGMWRTRLEYGIPLYEPHLRGVLFTDAGCVTDGFEDDLLNQARVAAGFGIRFRIPYLGPVPIALDFAWPLRSERGDGERVFSFSFDRPF